MNQMSNFGQNMETPLSQSNIQQQAAHQYAQSHPAFSVSQEQATQSQQSESSGREESQFDIFEWHPKYISCQKYFVDHAQHSAPVQAMAAFVNILLPCQQTPPISSTRRGNSNNSTFPNRYYSSSSSNNAAPTSNAGLPNVRSSDTPSTSLFPYLRRLVITGLDFPGVLHGFFGDDWAAGIGPLHEQERRNLLFAAKSGGWMGVKNDYDMGDNQTVPFLRPLQQAVELEVRAAERSWSEWLAMEDWMVGPRAPAPGEAGNASAGAAQGHGETRMTGTERVGDGFAA